MIESRISENNMPPNPVSLRIPTTLRVILVFLALAGYVIASGTALAQQENEWATHKTIPGYDPETEPPILIADQSGVVHAFSYQWIGEKEDQPLQGIMYNQWTAETGWSMPIDILLPPLKNQARLLDAFLDRQGYLHLLFFSGDEVGANVYYSKAPASAAGLASSWSEPLLVGEGAHDPQDGRLAGDGTGKLMALYSGDSYGTAWYMVTSIDNGDTWSESLLFFPTYVGGSQPFYLRMHHGESGLLHAVWSIQDASNHGQAIYYANFDFESMRWNEPLELASQDGDNLGTQAPAIVEHDGSLFMMYYDGGLGHQYFTRSIDGGRTWSKAIAPFPQVGLNGPAYFVTDSNNDLHLFWAQRLSSSDQFVAGSPDIHAVWHSVWQGTEWSQPESVVTGRKIIDKVGFSAFDPNTVQVAVSEGNKVLVTWRTDRGSRGNGVWYSSTTLAAPQLPRLPMPTVQPVQPADRVVADVASTPEPAIEAVPEFLDQLDIQDTTDRNPTDNLLYSLIPVALVILLIGIFYQLLQSRLR